MLVQENKAAFEDAFPILESNPFDNAYAVPIVESTNYNLIKLESLLEYQGSTTNDFGQALMEVCQSNNVDPNTVSFVVTEENMYLDTNLFSLVESLTEAGFDVSLDHTKEVWDFITDLNEALSDHKIDYRHGEYNDRPDSLEVISGQIAKDLHDNFQKMRALKNTPEGQKELENIKNTFRPFYGRMEKDRAAMNRHFFKGKGVEYTGQFIGPVGLGMPYTKADVDEAKKMAQKGNWSDLKYDRNKKFMDNLYDNQEVLLGLGAKAAVNQVQNTLVDSENNIRDIANRIENEQIPKNKIAELIAKLRNLYSKIMFEVKSGAYSFRSNNEFQRDVAKTLDFKSIKEIKDQCDKVPSKEQFKNLDMGGKVDAIKNGGKVALMVGGKLGNLAVKQLKHKLVEFGGKILWLIDKLLQKMQNAANKFSK